MTRPLTKAWFARAFAGTGAPTPIREAAELFCRTEGVPEGRSPVDFANTLALELSCGDGQGEFLEDVDASDEVVRSVAGVLLSRYGVSFDPCRDVGRLDALALLLGAHLRGERVKPGDVATRELQPADAPAFIAMIERNYFRFDSNGLHNLPRRETDFQRSVIGRAEALHYGAFAGAQCIAFAGVEKVRVGAMRESAAGVWYGVDVAFEGIGLAKNVALVALRAYLKRDPSLIAAVVHCRPVNRRSMQLAQSLGFEVDAEADYARFVSSRSVQKMRGLTASRDKILGARELAPTREAVATDTLSCKV